MQMETVKQRIIRLTQEILEVRVVKIVVGKHRKPVDREDTIIFHVDI